MFANRVSDLIDRVKLIATETGSEGSEGVYVSGCAGEVDFNQELCDPVEKEFGPAWQIRDLVKGFVGMKRVLVLTDRKSVV